MFGSAMVEQNLLPRACGSGQEPLRAGVNLAVGHQQPSAKPVLGSGEEEGGDGGLNGGVKNEWQRVIGIAEHCRALLLCSSARG